MKFKNLLFLSGTLAVLSANAAVTERKAPVYPTLGTQPAAYTGSDILTQRDGLYLYNTGAQGFFLGANDYYTRASVSIERGYQVYLEETENGNVALVDSVERNNSGVDVSDWGWRRTFADNGDGIWVDNNNGANNATWTFTANSNGTYTIANTPAAAGVFGVLTGDDTRCYIKDAATEGFNSEWIFVSEEEYKNFLASEAVVAYIAAINQYKADKALFDASAPLYNALLKAAEVGVKAEAYAEYEAVYNNEEATAAELAAAVEAVNKLIANVGFANATAANPSDVSGLLTNATFDTVGDFTGWNGDSFGAGGTTGPCAERYSMTFDTWQLVEDLPEGVYGVEAQGFFRAGYTDNCATAFAEGERPRAEIYGANVRTEGNDTIASPIINMFNTIEPGKSDVTDSGTLSATIDGEVYTVPNNMAAAVAYFEAGYYKGANALFPVTEGKAKIGARQKTKIDGDWAIFDNFQLKYYGNGADAYQLLNDNLLANNKIEIDEEEDLISGSLLDEYEEVSKKVVTAANYEQFIDNKTTLEDFVARLEANEAAWNTLVEEIENSKNIINEGGYQGTEVTAFLRSLARIEQNELSELELSTEEVVALTKQVTDDRISAINNAITPGTDVSNLLTNTDFSQGDTGWTLDNKNTTSNGVLVTNKNAKCAEGWNNSNFDIYQIVEGAPLGAYKITVQGFYRQGRGDAAWGYYFNDNGTKKDQIPEVPAYVYLNDNKTPLAYVFDYQVPEAENFYTGDYYTDKSSADVHYTYPNNMTDAGLAFDKGAYQMDAFGVVGKQGDALRIGVKGNTSQLNDSWAIFTRFKLTYMGKDAEIITPELSNLIAAGVTGQMGSDVKKQAEALLAEGQSALTSGEGDKIFDAYADILAYNSTIEASKANYETLKEAVTKLEQNVESSEAAQATQEQAIALLETLQSGLSNETLTDEELVSNVATIDELIKALAIPANIAEASDENPVDLTALIATPGFEKEDALGAKTNSLEGWQNTTGYNFGNNDTQKGALALEFYHKNFDMYQDIEGLPEGTYAVGVRAFSRVDNNAEGADHVLWTKGIETTTKLYAKGTNEAEVAVKHLESNDEASKESVSSGESTYTEGEGDAAVTYYKPNDMVSAAAYFSQTESYKNEVIVKVGEDGKLRIGIKDASANAWVLMDNFTLTYYGKNSTKDNPTGVAVVEAGKVVGSVKAIYTVDGVRVNSLQPGLNIVQVADENGNIVVKKIVK